MSLYEIIYNFLITNILPLNSVTQPLYNASFNIGGKGFGFAPWLCHTLTIFILILGLVVLMLVVRWIFRVMAGLIRV